MLRYRLEGNGLPLLLVHGWGVTYAIWQNLAPLLKPHFQLIMIELPGIGGSPEPPADQPYYLACAEAIEEVRVALGIERWAVLSYSSGTRAAEAYVQRYAQSVSQAIFLCPTYIMEIWAIFVRLLSMPHPTKLTNWIFSDWRLYSLVRALGFNGERHDYTYVWTNEIELQPLESLVRSLCEMPQRGRAPFQVPAVPTLFIWGDKDALIAQPRYPRENDVFIPANHSAPMLAALDVAEVVVPFLLEDRVVSLSRTQRTRSRRRSSFYTSLFASPSSSPRRDANLVQFQGQERRSLLRTRGVRNLRKRHAERRRFFLRRRKRPATNSLMQTMHMKQRQQ
jgi:pimeloyl-ACP methyl ester carboxylesterase